MFCLLNFCVLPQANAGLPATKHRRVACSFRDQSLFQIFQISLTSLSQLKNDGKMATPAVNFFCLFYTSGDLCLRIVIMYFAAISQLQELALSLSLKCLSFDFVGTSVDESSDEFGTVQVSACFCFIANF